jgi:hypothetical protein
MSHHLVRWSSCRSLWPLALAIPPLLFSLTQARASVNEAEPNAMVGGSTLVSLLATERRTMEVSLQGAVNPVANGDPRLTDPRPADLPPSFR